MQINSKSTVDQDTRGYHYSPSMIETFNHAQRKQPDKNTNESSIIGMPSDLPGPMNNSAQAVFGAMTDDLGRDSASSSNARLKRSSSSPYNYISANFIKRRLPNQEDSLPHNTQFLDSVAAASSAAAAGGQSISVPNTPSKAPTSRRPSLPRKVIDTSNGDAPGSPYYSLPNASVSNADLASKLTGEASGKAFPFLEKSTSQLIQTPSRLGTPYLYEEQQLSANLGKKGHGMSTFPLTSGREKTQTRGGALASSVSASNNNEINDGGFNFSGRNEGRGDDNHGGDIGSSNNDNTNGNLNNTNDDSGNSNDGGNNNNNSSRNGSVPSVVVPSKRSSQALVQKLQEIYKIIVKQEIELQEKCSQLTTSQTTELKNLWTIYKINSDLINNYVTFLTTALLPSQTEQDILIGEEIVEIYRIERRLWVYGTITFLDVLKNFSNFMDPEVCCQFITHVFISISNMLGDIPPKYNIPWLQRLGDLSRMAIALYPSGFIDWKLSAEHWYMEAMKFTYSHGKLYYHMSTVQQNTLEAFVNLGKSVFCKDTFIPSQQYMQLVIDNIYQRAFVERNNGNHRNTQLIEYLKHSEVMLLPSFLESADLQQVVLVYFKSKFGCDSNDSNMFDPRKMFCQNPDSLKYFFRHAPAFAESHILQLVGFGDPKNPFALLFELPKFLKDRRDKKEKRRTKSTPLTESSSTMAIDEFEGDQTEGINTPTGFFENVETLRFPYQVPSSMAIWNHSLRYVNMTSLKCSMVVLQKFLQGPLVVALPHFLPWTYFIISLSLKIKGLAEPSSQEFWRELIDRIFPWNTIVSFLNVLIAYMLDNSWKYSLVDSLCEQYSQLSFEELLALFNDNEELPEVWKCWGTLWFDNICSKDQNHVESFETVGIKNHMFLDSPIDGITFDEHDESGQNFWKRACRIIFLFKGLAENFNLGVTLSPMAPVYCRRIDVNPYHILRSFSFKMRRGMEPESDNSVDLTQLKETLELFENGSWDNIHMDAIPMLSVVEGESIFDYAGYRRLHPDYASYDKNGEFLSASLYTSWYANNNNCGSNVTGGVAGEGFDGNAEAIQRIEEMQVFNRCMEPGNSNEFADDGFLRDALANCDQSSTTYFVLDTTTWLRHFGHIYKLASNGVLKFAICLTTFHELRFLRKPKDENVVEAATRAIITVRQLYSEGKILPLRFTGNVATHIEEHLEFEEKITWRSHVDEFVIEAVSKAQKKFQDMNQSQQQLVQHDRRGLKFVVLVTDDSNMRKKAQDQQVRIFSTKFVFSLCNSIGLQNKVCTN